MAKIESLMKKEWLEPDKIVPVKKKGDKEKSKANLGQKILRESTMSVKSAKAEIWKIAAKVRMSILRLLNIIAFLPAIRVESTCVYLSPIED